ncbi:MAG: helix-turn-helix domain-containing protein [Pirellulaceae bacterium]
MAKLIQLQEAAQLLGISPDELTEMRSRNEIFGYRDGSTWKFKEQELERIAAERGITLGAAPSIPTADSMGDVDAVSLDEELTLDLDDLDLGGDAEESVSLGEAELAKTDDGTGSTVIGEPDLSLGSESDIQPIEEGGSELRLASGSGVVSPSDSELGLAGSDVLNMDASPVESGSAELAMAADELGDDLSLESSDDDIDLSLDDDELKLEDSGSLDLDEPHEKASKSPNASASASGFGSAIDLDLGDDDFVLGGSGSDVTGGAGDSGINLTSPSDSGLSLEEPLDLAGGSSIESLELGEDDMIVVDDAVDLDAGTDVQSDDDFLLTPMGGDLDEESDSGSQVIALDSEEFDESAATILGDAGGLGVDDFAEVDGGGFGDDAVDFESVGGFEEEATVVAGGSAAAGAALASTSVRQSTEAEYSIWNVLGLFTIVLVLGITGTMMMDLINNIWSWNQDLSYRSPLMDTIISMMGISK